MTEETLVHIMNTFETDQNRWIIQKVFKRAAWEMSTATLEGDGVCRGFKSAIIQAVASGTMIRAIASMVVEKKKIMAHVAKFVAF